MRALLLHESNKILHGPVTRVRDRAALVTSLVQLDEWYIWNVLKQIILHDVDLGNRNPIRTIGAAVHARKSLVHGVHRIAVGAVLAVEIEEDVLIAVQHNLLVRLGDHDAYGAIVGIWYGLRLDGWLETASSEASNKGIHICLGEGTFALVKRVLLLLGAIKDSQGGEGAVGRLSLEMEISGEALEVGYLGGRELDGACMILCDRSEKVLQGLAILIGLVENEHGGSVRARNVLAPRLGARLTNQRLEARLGKILDSVDVPALVEDHLAFAIGLVQHKGRERDASCLGRLGVCGHADGEILVELFRRSGKYIARGCVVVVKVPDKYDLRFFLEKEIIMLLLVSKIGDSGKELLGHEVDDSD